MYKIIPQKLQAGDEIRVIAPAKSFRRKFVEENLDKTIFYFKEEFGLTVSLGKHVFESDEFETAPLEHCLNDLDDAFLDKNVKGVLTVFGGTNSNQLLKYIDYGLIKQNPKILCGLSDITALTNALYAKIGLVTYSGPHFTVFGTDYNLEFTKEYFTKALFSAEDYTVKPSSIYFDSRSAGEDPLHNEGHWIMNEGFAEGCVVGGNLITFNLLQGTEYFPLLKDTIVFIEDNAKENYRAFENHLQSLILQKDFDLVRGLLIGRFQKESGVTQDLLRKIISTKKELRNIPIIANVDFGHTVPMITLPIGGHMQIKAGKNISEITIQIY